MKAGSETETEDTMYQRPAHEYQDVPNAVQAKREADYAREQAAERRREHMILNSLTEHRPEIVTGEAADFYALVRGSLAEDLGIEASTSNSSLYVIAESEKILAEVQGQVVTGIYEYLVDLRDGLDRA